jgi:hypothetical protein
MKKKAQSKITHLTTAAIALILCSCVAHYVPNVTNTPLFSYPGQPSLAIHTGFSGVDPQFAVSITDNLALMMNASFANREYIEKESSNMFKYHKHQFFEVAAGYYHPTGNDTRVEGFAGMGKGRTRAFDDTWGSARSIDSKFTRYFIQPTFGMSMDVFEGSGSARLAMVRFEDRKIGTGFYLEPALTGKAGLTWLKFVFQIGFSLQLNFESNPIEYNPFMFSIGLEAKPGKKSNSEKNSTTAKLKSAYLP